MKLIKNIKRILFGKKIRHPVTKQILHIVSEPNDYPKTVAEVLNDDLKYKKATLATLEKFKKSRPWKGTKKQRQDKILELNVELSKIYGIKAPTIIFDADISCYIHKPSNMILLELERDNQYSVVTYLHEVGHALGKGERATCRWSINLFRLVFPKSFAKLEPRGHLLYKKK